MTINDTHFSINNLLAIDAVACLTMGAALLFGATLISEITQIPGSLLFWAGVTLIPVAAFMLISSRTIPVARWTASLIVLGNLLWVTASILLPATGLIAPNAIGWVFLITQAVVVAILAKLEIDALRARFIAT